MAIKVLATADLHLGKSSSSIFNRSEVTSTKYTWNRIVDWSVRNDIDVLLLCGDIIDKDNRYFEAIGPLQSGFDKLKLAEVSVYMVSGNHDHDVLSQIVQSKKYEHVHLLGFNGKWEVKTFSKGEDKIQLVGWSFPKQFVTEDPLSTFKEIGLDPNYPVIGLLHGDVDNRESKYGPIDLNNLTNTQVNIWILGHIHKLQELRNHEPSIWYPGSPHAMSAKEPGIHGPLLLTIEGAHDIKVRTVPMSPVRYESIFIDITTATDEAKVRDKITSTLFNDASDEIEELEEVAFLVYDVYLMGQHTDIKQVEIWTMSIVNDYDQEIGSGTRISVRKVVSNIRRAVQNLEELAKQPSPAGILAEAILAVQNENSTPFVDELLKQWDGNIEAINNSGIYQPLRAAGKQNNKDVKKAKDSILRECSRLLAELIVQQAK